MYDLKKNNYLHILSFIKYIWNKISVLKWTFVMKCLKKNPLKQQIRYLESMKKKGGSVFDKIKKL